MALTRAKQRLLVASTAFRDKTAPDSWHALVRKGLEALPGTATVETPFGDGLRYGARLGLTQDTLTPVTLAVLPKWAMQPASADLPAQRRAASKLVDEGDGPPVLSPLTEGGTQRFRRGALIHKLLEILPELSAGDRRVAADRFLAREADLDADARAQMVRETLTILDDAAFAPLFGPDSRAEAPLIGAAPGLPKGLIVDGRVDRLVIGEEVMAVDYKTDRPPPLRAEEIAPVYLRQMAAYRAVLANLFPHKKVRCTLLWTDGPQLMELPPALLDKAFAGAP